MKISAAVRLSWAFPTTIAALSSIIDMSTLRNKFGMAATIGVWSLGIATDSAVAGDYVDQGEKLFNANCAACHRGGRNLIVPEKSLEKEALEQQYRRSEESISKQIRNGRNSMPAFGGRLDEESIANVAAYVIKSSEEGWN